MLHVNIGMSMIPIPSAREWWIDTRKFTDEAVTPMMNTASARTAPVDPMLGVYIGMLSGAYIVQPALSVPPWKKLTPSRTPENRYIQYESAFSRGKAKSSAPIWSGTK
jgi:hypothetical protein